MSEYEKIVKEKSKFKKCTLDGLAEWMKKNPSAFIVTDLKTNKNRKFYDALNMTAQSVPNSSSRIIPQIYYPTQFKKVKKIGFKQIIWTLYRYHENDDNVLKWVDTFDIPFAVTMSEERGFTSLPRRLQEKGVPSYVHTVNSQYKKEQLLNNFFVSEIYTDFLHKK